MNAKGLILPCISVIISLIALGGSFLKVGITSEFFISLIASLMGVCATIMVGLQIFNSIEFNKAMKDLNILRKEIEDVRSSTDLQKSHLRLVQGISISINQQYISAMYSFYWAMNYAILADDYKTMNLVMDNIQNVYVNHIKDKIISNVLENDDKDIKDNFLGIDIKSLPNSSNYSYFKVKFERIILNIQNDLRS